ncbi:MAG: iron ABC transporter permease [Oscillospiraceae bacterium]|nr:iron ABC transporter permease [Oscillospiraceae bacterium]
MKSTRTVRTAAGFLILILLAAVLFCLSLTTGTGRISASEAIRILMQGRTDSASARIIFDIRMPRALSAMLLGGALAVAGFLLQSFFRNPIAGPFVLGISSGAKLCVALVMIAAMQQGMLLHSGILVAAAFAGALLCMLTVLLFAGKVRHMAQLIISGVMIGYICSALTDLAVTFADDANIVNLHNWSRGSFSGTGWTDIRDMAVIIAAAMAGAVLISKPIAAYQLGEEYARSMGVRILPFRIGLILLSSLLAACVTAFAGPVSFVGIAVPHLVRSLFRTARPLIIIPAAFLGGSVFCMGCDLLARMLFAPQELSVSTVTAVFGAPVVLWVMLRRERGRS